MKNQIHLRTALVIGSTGMVGKELIKQLTASADFEQITSLVRRPSGFTHPKLTEHVVDFDKSDSWSHLLKGDVLFSSMGTTLAAAGSKEKQYKIDFTYQYETARIASENGVSVYVLVSSAGASVKGSTFYLKMKGELDEVVQKMPFKFVHILRPGQLYGDRTKKRTAEALAVKLMFFFNKIGLLRKYKPIHSSQVAFAMINVSSETKNSIYVLDKIFEKL